jgi:uncharacterized membrane protein YcaP (DUF421 family)
MPQNVEFCKKHSPLFRDFPHSTKEVGINQGVFGNNNHERKTVVRAGGTVLAICFFRTVILYLLLIVAVRLMGKKQVGELEPTELVLAMLLSDLASVPMQDFGLPLLFGVLPIVILVCLTMILSVLTLKSIRLRELLYGRPSLILDHGRLLQGELERNRLTVDELMEELRKQGIVDFSAVKYAILENSGEISVIPYEGEAPATPKQLSLCVAEAGLPVVVVNDGRILDHNLRHMGRDRSWLYQKLREQGLGSVKEVFLMTLNESGGIYLAPKERQEGRA